MATIRDDWKDRIEEMRGKGWSKNEAPVVCWGGIIGLVASHAMMGSKHDVIRHLAVPTAFLATAAFGSFLLEAGKKIVIEDVENMIETDTEKTD